MRATERRVGRDSADARDLHLELLAQLVLELHLGADADAAGSGRVVHDSRSVEAGAQAPDAALEHALLVLGGVVLEVLGESPKPRGRDRLDDLGAPRALELGELGLELRFLRAVSRSDFSVAIAGG